MTSGDLDIDLSEKMTEVTSFGILTRSRIPFTASFYLSPFQPPVSEIEWGLKSTPRHGAECQEARHGAG